MTAPTDDELKAPLKLRNRTSDNDLREIIALGKHLCGIIFQARIITESAEDMEKCLKFIGGAPLGWPAAAEALLELREEAASYKAWAEFLVKILKSENEALKARLKEPETHE